MSYVSEWEAVKAVFDGWTPPAGLTQPYGPNLAPVPPDPSSDPADPIFWGEWDVFYSGSDAHGHEGGAVQTTFGGSEEVHGRVQVVIRQQVGSGDGKVRAMEDALNALFFPLGTPLKSGGLEFSCPDPGDPLTEGNFYGRPLHIYFTRFEEHG